ncbi:heat-inducible protein [compost metagenome]|jgi:heat shock protein HslJ
MPIFSSLRCRLLCLSLLTVALAGCAGSIGGARPEGAAAANAASSADSLAQTSWELVRWTQPGGALRDIPHGDNGEPIRLTFLAQGKQYRVNGFSGCNRYMGTYKLEGGKLFIDAPAMTRMACAPPERAKLEADYLRGLATIDTFTLDSGGAPRHLTFNLRGGDVLEFERRQDPPTP